jgi:predicted Zn-dependent peptidase
MRQQAIRFGALVTLGAVLLVLPVSAQVDDHRDIKYPRLPDFKIQKPEVFSLENGMQVFLQEDHELPLITVNARIRTGANHEPADKVGLAGLMGTVQRTGGTATMTGDEIDDFLAARAAYVETGIGGDAGFASMSCLKGDFPEVLEVFSEVLRTPAFAEDKLRVAKVQSNTAISRRNDNVGGITSREFARLIYGPDSPLGRLEEYATIAAITRDDLIAWHGKYYHPNNVMLGIVGDFDSGAMRKSIESTFGDWPKGPAIDPPEVEYRKSANPGVYFIEKSDVTQANISVGHLGISRKNPDLFAVEVMNQVLSGGFASRLFSNIRTKKGLAYSVFGGVRSSYVRRGIFRAGMQTKSSTMAEAVDALVSELRSMITTPPTDAELSRAKESILNSFIFNYDSKSEILSQQMTYAYHGFPPDFLETYRSNIEKVTREDVTRVAKKYIKPEELTILVVGKAADFDKPLDTFGEVTTLDITIPPPPDTSPKVEKTASGLEAGAKVMARVVEAISNGNAPSLDAARSEDSVAISMGGQSMSLNRSAVLVFPDKGRLTMQTPMGEQVMAFDGEEGFAVTGGQVQDIPADRVASIKEDLARELLFLVRYHDDPTLEAILAGEEELNGVSCAVLAVTFRGLDFRIWVDADGKVLKQAYQGEHPFTGAPGQVEKLFSDYRDVEGWSIPFREVMTVDGEEVMTTTVGTVELNPEVDPAAFQKP